MTTSRAQHDRLLAWVNEREAALGIQDPEVKYLRMTIDVAVLDGAQKIAKYLVKEGGPLGVGERAARIFMEAIKDGHIEIDEVRDVENHT